MYLKSLVLKGFKSFADRSVLSLQPGITAVVGPNGSGKSNISDAVIWVLGERNARNLRGQAMEDVIFSGSSARKPVSVAEVELVLDNSDNKLPVDFDEVSITRRMYRSGESEYLINGVVARRMDVLDILHDSGLGTGTHSIISQGKLDQILQSRPEDRRALIEEAAGVLKHKQRKEKSARKLEQMDNHLARVRDVTAEINRQLGPLERKAKRAIAYEEASSRLHEVQLALAVDDLRKLQVSWDRVCSTEAALEAEIADRKQQVSLAEQKVSDIQELIRTNANDAGELTRSQRKASAVAERLDSAEMLLREKRRSAESYEADIALSLENAETGKAAAQRELETAQASLDEASRALDVAREKLSAVETKRSETYEKRRALEKSVDEFDAEQRRLDREYDEVRRRLADVKERLSSGIAQEKLVDARRSEIDAELASATQEHDNLAAAHMRAQKLLEELSAADKQAQSALGAAFAARGEARTAKDAADDEQRVIAAEIKAIEQSLRASQSDDPALLWLLDNSERFGGGLAPLAQALGAPVGLESLVERLLGADLAALMVDDSRTASEIVDALRTENRSGDVSLVLKNARIAGASADCPARGCRVGTALVDELKYPAENERIVFALLGDVVLCANREEAFAAYEADETGVRFATADGCVIWPQGKVSVFGAASDEDEGVLARERRLNELGERLSRAQASAAEAKGNLESAEEAYRVAQEASLKASQERAKQNGVVEAAAADEQRAASRMNALAKESETVGARHEDALKTVEQLKPDAEALETQLADLEKQRAAAIESHNAALDEVVPLRREAGRLNDELSNAKLELAKLTERKTYAERMVQARVRDIAQSEESQAESRANLVRKQVAQRRAVPLLSMLDLLSQSLRQRVQAIDDAISASEDSTNGFQASAAEARTTARRAHDDFDEANSRMTQTRVEKGRLELQVQTAVNAVVSDLSTPLEVAQELPTLEDRAAYEDESFKLQRRIKNMGVINPDAADEYEKLKKRYDYFAAQLDDMEHARRSLSKIVRVIDERMRDDFAVTFEQVNKNFSETFATLFPGGNAELVLENPDDLEHTGVEVKAQPRGKRITKMSLMSGGEKSLTALALLFAIYRIRKAPFYILDEVEAALDDTNLRRLVAYIDSLRETTQLIMITHQRRSMEMADVLFGVSMQADGVTKVLSQKLEHALENAE
jgi:chromosome segregation protein